MSKSSIDKQFHRLDDVTQVISYDMKFKAKLGVGAEAFTSLIVGRSVQQLWGVGDAAATGAGIASSGIVAPTFLRAVASGQRWGLGPSLRRRSGG
jgi:hypothetical protein